MSKVAGKTRRQSSKKASSAKKKSTTVRARPKKTATSGSRRTAPAARGTARRAAPAAKPARARAKAAAPQAKAAAPQATAPVRRKPVQPAAGRRKPADEGANSGMIAKKTTQRLGFKTTEFIVYPAHGVGQITAIEEQEVAGLKLELFVINFVKDKMTLRVPTA
jgi:CarD family transcriptional regulator